MIADCLQVFFSCHFTPRNILPVRNPSRHAHHGYRQALSALSAKNTLQVSGVVRPSDSICMLGSSGLILPNRQHPNRGLDDFYTGFPIASRIGTDRNSIQIWVDFHNRDR